MIRRGSIRTKTIKNKRMKKKMIQYAFTGAVAGIVIYLVRKKIVNVNKRKVAMKNEEEFVRNQRRRFSESYGEYTL